MTAIGLYSYELFVKLFDFYVFFSIDIVTFCIKSLFHFYIILCPFFMIVCFCLCIASGYYFFRIMTSWLILTSFCDFLDFLGPWAQGPWAQGPWAHGPWAHGPWAHGPWAHGPRALWRRAERREFSKSSLHPSQPAPRGRDKPVVETPHWDIQPPFKGYQ